MSIKSIFITAVIALSSSIFFFFFPSHDPSSYHSLFISPALSSNDSIAAHLRTLTRRPHIAGSEANYEAGDYVLSTLSSLGISSRVMPYEAALDYPGHRSLVLLADPRVEFALVQETYEGDPYANVSAEAVPTFHAYARSGTAVGPVAYANYGRVEDYEVLKQMGVNISGSVVLARYGQIFRGDIVDNAFAEGAVGVLVFTDRKDFGGDEWFPDDRWMPPSGVQLGSVYSGMGDPTTPGWPSTPACERISDDQVADVPLIPSLPISWADAHVIIREIGGQVAADDWQGGKDAPVYRLGPGPAAVNLTYIGNQVIKRIENVIGVIEGWQEPDRYVILGNHRDAWSFGAADPNSGTACLLEIAERLYKLQQKGWKPRRTIIFCSWDGEEFGLIGSTEWVEENRQMLVSRAVAYLNLDVAVAGPLILPPSATPQLDDLLAQAAKQVPDPNNSSQSIYDSWISSTDDFTFGRLGGGGSDYASFVQHIGIPASDLSLGGDYPVYHSLYDDFVWMSKFGDPMFQKHVAAVASLSGLVALRLADDEILPFNYTSYALELQKSAEELKSRLLNRTVTLDPLFKSINDLEKAAANINNERKALMESKGWSSVRIDEQKARELNDRLMMTERAFTDSDGLTGRSWYKHLIYGPSRNDEYGSSSFPGVDDAIGNALDLNTSESWSSVQHEIWRVARVVTQASLCLGGTLT
ncbi:Peptidase M28 family protein [Striga hermonthica]|uniref:Peptidase M28 family protein n=1 Tax=Striga hermonthica TaxID=68872 RepID=A0A9N7NET1_STRHE|nr:Peptidase M28 family protein [Striga hermonthica]